jgi:hypothetical protein
MDYWYSLWKDNVIVYMYRDMPVAFEKAKAEGLTMYRLRIFPEGQTTMMKLYSPPVAV